MATNGCANYNRTMQVYRICYARPVSEGPYQGLLAGAFIVFYSTLSRAEEARDRLARRPGFRDHSEGLSIQTAALDPIDAELAALTDLNIEGAPSAVKTVFTWCFVRPESDGTWKCTFQREYSSLKNAEHVQEQLRN